ncbi:phosphotransferase family protein [Streptomyces sp. PSKA30]|uniref:phosphotransferase family protein n=1 Tax=Streptomyces sp. PSKA30 TaxID=2874597 RepID=UPI001CD12CAE|nr:aminoglycoside phosphotransferase family protein [Streptomyces sp. PSKA30]MBZ9644877.1 aminoglycoside phosphotransferase family protein [Streptomyces sp. PSKA30]
MEFRPITRAPGAFQQSVTADDIKAICRRVFGPNTKVAAAAELGTGMYNTTYRVTVAGRERTVIVRIAPEAERQFTSERALMRNEYASLPYLAALAPLMPHVLAVDFTHEIIGRDYMVQSLLDGIPATEHLHTYPRSAWPVYYRQLGEITRRVHDVRGPAFGPIAAPAYGRWSEAVAASLKDIATDLEGVGLDAADVHKVSTAVHHHQAVLDEITEPRMLAGDLWLPNTQLDHQAPEPAITGTYDFDRTWWGDPAADWTIRMVSAKQDERTAFWETYGPNDDSPHARLRARLYEARHLGAIRLERQRLGNYEGVHASYDAMADILATVG